VEFQPDYTQSWEAMARLAGKLGKTRVEIAAWRRVHEITPHAPDATVRLTRLLATADVRKGGDPTKALTLAKQLLRRRDVDRRTALDCLAAAQRANGQFAAAEETASEALRLPGSRAEQRRLEPEYRADRPSRNADPDRLRR
jgi:Flp pilus assembly protein TadD